MTKIPRSVLALFGEFIVEHNKMDYKLKKFLIFLLEENESLGILFVSNQGFEYVKKRVAAVYKHVIDNPALLARWKALEPEITQLTEIRNDIAHSIIDIDPDTRKLMVLSRYSESSVMKNLGSKDTLYELSDLKLSLTKQKEINRKLGYLLHTTYKEYSGAIFSSRQIIF